jgi:hypothetical protein
MPAKRGLIPNMGDVSQATRVQLGQLGGARTRRGGGTARRATRVRSKTRSRVGKGSKSSRVRKKRSTSSARRKGGKLRKGSAAAKAWGARMKRLRKRR